MSFAADSPTGLRILESAEALFAAYGYEATSLRAVTAQARVNLAAVNYHFYDKPGLYTAVVKRRLTQINEERLALLNVVLTRAGDSPAPLPEILDSLARPVFVPSAAVGPHAARLLGRLLSERQPFADALLREEFQPAITRFGQALRRHQPTLPPADFVWRLSFVIGALHHAVVTLPDMSLHTSGLCRPEDCAAALRNFIHFGSKALSA